MGRRRSRTEPYTRTIRRTAPLRTSQRRSCRTSPALSTSICRRARVRALYNPSETDHNIRNSRPATEARRESRWREKPSIDRGARQYRQIGRSSRRRGPFVPLAFFLPAALDLTRQSGNRPPPPAHPLEPPIWISSVSPQLKRRIRAL